MTREKFYFIGLWIVAIGLIAMFAYLSYNQYKHSSYDYVINRTECGIINGNKVCYEVISSYKEVPANIKNIDKAMGRAIKDESRLEAGK